MNISHVVAGTEIIVQHRRQLIVSSAEPISFKGNVRHMSRKAGTASAGSATAVDVVVMHVQLAFSSAEVDRVFSSLSFQSLLNTFTNQHEHIQFTANYALLALILDASAPDEKNNKKKFEWRSRTSPESPQAGIASTSSHSLAAEFADDPKNPRVMELNKLNTSVS